MNLFYFILFCAIRSGKSNDGPVVTISTGKIRGTTNKTVGMNKTYHAFRGIPYAQPPVDGLRFQPPVPATPWNGILPTTTDGSDCVQGFPAHGSEDCLFINVYTTSLQNKTLLPVMVWIHGGSFTGGSSTYSSYGPDYFLDQDVIIVSLNYRVGIFGFLSTGDLVAPGNNGLRDQILALKWVKQNIQFFGGNSNKVTIFGESAGSASVSYLLQTNLTRHLYNGAILESGTSLCLWALTRNARNMAFTIGASFDFSKNNSQELVNGLRNISSTTLQQTSNVFSKAFIIGTNPLNGLVFSPVIEPEHPDAVVDYKSHELLKHGKFIRVPAIIGFNSQEGNVNLSDFYLSFAHVYSTTYDLATARLVPIDMNVNTKDTLTVATKIKFHYWRHGTIARGIAKTVQFISDDMFNRPIRETVNLLSKSVPVYFYNFSYVGPLGVADSYKRTAGVGHGDEMNYMWRRNINATASDEQTRQRLVKLWTNFAKFQNPTPVKDSLFQNVTWPPARESGNDTNDLTYLDIGWSLVVDVNPNSKQIDFWNRLYDKYGNPPYDTY